MATQIRRLDALREALAVPLESAASSREGAYSRASGAQVREHDWLTAGSEVE
jgi:hypothetical protein